MKTGNSWISGQGSPGWLVIPALTAAVLLTTAALVYALMPASFDPARVTWSELEYKASKLGFSTRSHFTLETVSTKQAEQSFIATVNGHGLRPDTPEILKLGITTSLLGQNTTLSLWFDPKTAVAFQSLQLTTGSRQRYKAYRFADRYVHAFLRKPEDGESELTPDRWSFAEDERLPHPAWAGDSLVVTFPTALFYILSTASLSKVGDSVVIPVFSNTAVNLMRVRVESEDRLKSDFTVVTPGSRTTHLKGRRDTLRLRLRAQSLDKTQQSSFELLGLRGDVEIQIDRQYRVPLEIRGTIPHAGRVKVKLKQIVLK